MEIKGYKIFYINRYKQITDILYLIKNTSSEKIVLVIRSYEVVLSNLDKIKLLKNKLNKKIVFINSNNFFLEKIKETQFYAFSDLKNFKKSLPLKIKQKDSINDNSNFSNYNVKKILKDKIKKTKNLNKKTEKDTSKDDKRYYLKHYLLAFVGLIICVFLAWIYFVSPAVISITPAVEKAVQEINLTGSLQKNSIVWEDKILPLHKFEVDLTDSYEVKTTGKKKVGQKKAEGKVKFINEREEKVKIPENTLLKANNEMKFKTKEEVIIPEMEMIYLEEEKIGAQAGEKNVRIQAVSKGEKGNVEIGAITDFADDNKQKVYVINHEPIQGGKDDIISVVTEKDRQRVKEKLRDITKSNLLNQLYQELEGNYRLIEDNIEFKWMDYNFSQEIGGEAKSIQGVVNVQAKGFLIHNSQLNTMISTLFQSQLNNQKLTGNKINISEFELEEIDNYLYNIKIKGEAAAISHFNSDELARKLAGKDVDEAREILKEKKSINNFNIDVTQNKLPGFSHLIRFVIQEPQAQKVMLDKE